MPGISVHVVDVAHGVPAEGMRIEIYTLVGERRRIADGVLGPSGLLDHPTASETLPVGEYEVVFHAGEFFRKTTLGADKKPFLEQVPFRFMLSDPAQHYHLPMKITPFGFSLYRGS